MTLNLARGYLSAARKPGKFIQNKFTVYEEQHILINAAYLADTLAAKD